MNLPTDSGPRSGSARIIGISGQILGLVVASVTALIWLAVLWLPSEREVLGHFGVVGAALMLFFAILGALAAHRGHGKLMFAMFLAAFLPIGMYMLWTEQSMYRWIGLLNLIYLAAAVMVLSTRTVTASPDVDVHGANE